MAGDSDLGAIGAIGAVAHGRSDLLVMLDRRAAIQSAIEMAGSDGTIVWVAEPIDGLVASEELTLQHVRGDQTGVLRGLRVPRGMGITGKVLDTARAAWVNDYFTATTISHVFDRQIEDEGVQRVLGVPVVRAERVEAVLAVAVRVEGTFGDAFVERTRRLADELALSVALAERARLAREVAIHEERSRLAVELHDSVGALLFAIGSGIANLSAAASTDPNILGQLERLQGQAADASTALRDSLRSLRSSPSALALGVALREDCTAFTDRTGISAEVVILHNDPPELPPSRVNVLVQAVREALLNVEKHSQAHAVVVSAGRKQDGGVFVAVTDDGVGVPPDLTPGIGLSNMAASIGRIGGRFSIANDQPGTTVRIELPC